MTLTQLQTHLGELISNNRFKELFELLEKIITPQSSIYNNFILFKSNYNIYKKNKLMSLSTSEQSNLERSKVVKGLLDLFDSLLPSDLNYIGEEDAAQIEATGKSDLVKLVFFLNENLDRLRKRLSTQKLLLILLSTIFIAGSVIFYFQFQKAQKDFSIFGAWEDWQESERKFAEDFFNAPKATIDSLSHEFEALDSAKDQLETKYKATLVQVRDFKYDLEDTQKEITSLQAKMDSLSIETESLKKENARLNNRIRVLNEQQKGNLKKIPKGG